MVKGAKVRKLPKSGAVIRDHLPAGPMQKAMISRPRAFALGIRESRRRFSMRGIENASRKNLKAAQKGDILDASRRAVELCHKHGIMVVAGMIFGFPDDEEQDIVDNYRFLKEIDADSPYCQILTPYPKTGIRQHLLDEGLVTNPDDFSTYNGIWANVRTRHLDADTLQYLVWYHRQQVLGWWEPSRQARKQGPLWIGIWIYLVRPVLKVVLGHRRRKIGWRGGYEQEMARLRAANRFEELES